MRYLAIDLGDARTGLALGDDVTRVATPAGLIEVPITRDEGRALMDALVCAIEDLLGPHDEIVLGLPVNMDGSEGSRARLARSFAERLGASCGRVVHLQDERLTSAEADWALAGSGLSHGQKKQRRDQIAAVRILEDFLASLDGGGNAPPGP